MLLEGLVIFWCLVTNALSLSSGLIDRPKEMEASLGIWGTIAFCPIGTRAIGFSLKIQNNQGRRDDTGLNGIAIRCSNGKIATSLEGPWGEWTPFRYCRDHNFLVSARLRIEMPRYGDKAGATNADFRCSNGAVVSGDGMRWGTLTPWKATCVNGVCGIASNVLPYQADDGDDTGLNDFQIFCC